MKRKNREEKSGAEETVDLAELSRIQPHGGITFRDESMVKTGNGYESCVHIYQYPTELHDHWLSKTCNLPGTIATVDISTDDVNEVKKNINRSMKEQNMRYQSASDFGERYDAQMRFDEMKTLYREINSMGEVIKLIDTRIYLSDYTKAGLENKIKNLMAKLGSDYKPTVYLNETKKEWLSMFRPYKEQQEEQFAVPGQTLTSQAVAGGNPFHFSDLQDPYGTYYGQTACGGIVNFDLCAKTKKRLYYNGVIFGEMGAGKSTLLKKMFEDRAARGDFVRTFDISGEFTDLTNEFGGKIINLDGRNGILNPLEILPASESEQLNYTMHLSKVSAIYKFLDPAADSEKIKEFTRLLRELYAEFELFPESGKQITGLPPERYPVFSDILDFVDEKISRINAGTYNDTELEVAKKHILALDSIRDTVQNIVFNYGMVFNGHTSIPNITDEQIVTFNLSKVKEMSENIFDAAIFNMVSLCWGNCVSNGSIMKDLWESGKIKWEEIVHFLMLIDEGHRWLNTKKLQALELISVYFREARKYFASIVLASQSVRDYVPGGRSESSDAAVNQIKTLFELTQYKFIFRQNENALGIISDVFSNAFTESQLKKIPYLEQGNTILNISGDRTLEFKVYLSAEEKRIFRGGA